MDYIAEVHIRLNKRLSPGEECDLEDKIANALDEALPKKFDVLTVTVRKGSPS